jgi:hypothetical protein
MLCVCSCSKYLENNNQRLRKLKVLEIGLGCNMHYGPGESVGSEPAATL